jgi:hypothetical protein
MNRAPGLLALAAFAVLLTLYSSVKPQEKKNEDPKRSGQNVVKLKAELVQIDVAVYDRNNKPVTGLKREDFELFDGNKLQAISHFSEELSTSTALRIEDDVETPQSRDPQGDTQTRAAVDPHYHSESRNLPAPDVRPRNRDRAHRDS